MTLELEDTAQAAAVSQTATALPRVVGPGVGRELAEGKRLGHFQIVKRTVWDRWSGMMVRYRTARRA